MICPEVILCSWRDVCNPRTDWLTNNHSAPCYIVVCTVSINPFTAPACKISWLKDAQMHLKNGIFSGPVTHLLSALCVLIKLLSHASVKKKAKRRKGFKFRTLLVILSSDIMAVKGLSTSAMTHKQLKGTLILMEQYNSKRRHIFWVGSFSFKKLTFVPLTFVCLFCRITCLKKGSTMEFAGVLYFSNKKGVHFNLLHVLVLFPFVFLGWGWWWVRVMYSLYSELCTVCYFSTQYGSFEVYVTNMLRSLQVAGSVRHKHVSQFTSGR